MQNHGFLKREENTRISMPLDCQKCLHNPNRSTNEAKEYGGQNWIFKFESFRHALSETLIMVDATINIYEEKTTATLSYLLNNLLKPTLFYFKYRVSLLNTTFKQASMFIFVAAFLLSIKLGACMIIFLQLHFYFIKTQLISTQPP